MTIVSAKLRQSAVPRFVCKYRVCPLSECWLWTASVNKKRGGYGRFSFGCKTIGAHKAAWILYRGDIPAGMHVLHRCDNPLCVNPDHLFLGTNADNVADMDAKGRRINAPLIGEANPRAKLDESQVLEIFRSRGKQNEAAAKFGVSRALIGMIRHGRVWSHVTGASQ